MTILSRNILIIVMVLSSCAKFIMESDADLMTEESLRRDPLVSVEGTSKHFNIDEYELTHLKYVEVGKNKRKVYESFVRKYKKIISCLVKYQVVPHESAMIHSAIQMNFNSKKRAWEFSRVFVIYSDSDQLSRVLKYLEPFKLTTLK